MVNQEIQVLQDDLDQVDLQDMVADRGPEELLDPKEQQDTQVLLERRDHEEPKDELVTEEYKEKQVQLDDMGQLDDKVNEVLQELLERMENQVPQGNKDHKVWLEPSVV